MNKHLLGLLLGVVLSAGCSGQLLIDGLQDGGPGLCVSSSVCGTGQVCVDGSCINSPGRCSSTQPNGDCPAGRICVGGICSIDPDFNSNNNNNNENNNGQFDCTDCDPGEYCGADSCVDPSDATAVCSALVIDGACPAGDVCVVGTCVEIKPGKNDCSADRPTGLCPTGAYCLDGFCLPIDERPCSGVTPDGACPAGQICAAGGDGPECVVLACSDENGDAGLFAGECLPSQVCLNGECESVSALQSCAELEAVSTCASRNREECSTGADGIDRCGECLPGFDETEFGACVSRACADLDCDEDNRICDSNASPVACAGCLDGYADVSGNCEAITACANRGCDALNRECVEGSGEMPATCTTCVDTFVDTSGSCVPATCADLNCGAQNRVCIPETPAEGASCGDCLPPAVEIDGQCTECDSTADCAGDGYCDAVTRLCTVDCNTVNDCPDTENFVCTVNNRCAQIGPGPNGVCGAGFIEGEVVEPIVAILVDRSGSMNALFDIELQSGTSGCDRVSSDECSIGRWYAVEAILFGDTEGRSVRVLNNGTPIAVTEENRDVQPDPATLGLVTKFQDQIQFTVTAYTGEDRDDEEDLYLEVRYPKVGGGVTTNPAEAIAPRLNTASDLDGPSSHRTALAEFFAEQVWLEDTPTGAALRALDDYLRNLREQRVAAGGKANPLYVVLATDGRPDFPGCLDPQPTSIAEYQVLEAVDQARREQHIDGTTYDGVTTFTLSVGADIDLNHFQDVANAGAGARTMLSNIVPTLNDIGTYPGIDPLVLQSRPYTTAERNYASPMVNPYFELYTGADSTIDPDDFVDGISQFNGDACINGYASQNQLPTDGNNDGNFSGCFVTGDSRLRSCRASNWELDYEEFFVDLSSDTACGASNPCAMANEVCCGVDSGAFSVADCSGVSNVCRVASCTPEGTRDENGNVVMAPCFVGNDGAELGEALEGIFNEVLSCTIEIDANRLIEKGGTVYLDDDPIPLSAWVVRGPFEIEIIDDPGQNDDPCDIIKDGNPHFVNAEIDACSDEG